MTTNAIGFLLSVCAVAFVMPPASHAAPAAPSSQDSPVEIDAPKLALTGVGYELELQLAGGEPATAFRLLTSGGGELASGLLIPGETVTLEHLEIKDGDAPLALVLGATPDEIGTSRIAIDLLVLPGWTSLLPPLIAIGLALVFKEVVISLFVGVWFGALFVAGLNPISATMRTVDTFIVPALADPDHAAILVFSALLMAMVGVMSRSGGTVGIVNAIRPLATTPRRAQLAAYLGGLAIFFDDYANTLIVGPTMRPITDRMRVSREKLAYIVDSTAAPVAGIVFVSTWAGYEIGLIADGLRAAAALPGTSPEVAADLLAASPFAVFMYSIPYRFYPILALIMVGLVVFTQRDFGPMWKAENRASRGEGLYREGAALLVDTEAEAMMPIEGAPERWYNAAIPVLVVVLGVILGLYFDGRAALGGSGSLSDIFSAANSYNALLWGSLAGLLVAILLSIAQRILTTIQAVEAAVGGMKATLLAFIILILAWSLAEVTAVMGTAEYLAGLLSGNLPPEFLPVLVFLMSAAISFATGTSWGTMAILLPLVIPLAVALTGGGDFNGGASYSIVLGAASSVLAGSIWGDHCSPISDTTVLSSMASACDHIDHVRTQLPYALLVGVVGMIVGDIATAYGVHPIFSYVVGAAVLYAVLRFYGRPDMDSPQFAEAPASPRPGEEADAVVA